MIPHSFNLCGFSLIENLVALCLLSIGLLCLQAYQLQVVTTTSQSLAQAHQYYCQYEIAVLDKMSGRVPQTLYQALGCQS